MKKILLIAFCNIVAFMSIAQVTEDERRAVIAAKNKIKADSLTIHSRSMRVQECKRQNEQLTEALENAYKTIELHEELKEVLQTDLDLCSDSLAATTTQLEDASKKATKEEKRKKGWRKAFFITAAIVAVETAILIIL